MREHDWSTSPLGWPRTWPQSLRTAVSLMLNSRYPMFIAWGPELAFLYNDGYRPIFGAKHPHTLGLPFAQVWPEIWDDIKPLIDRALAGEATFNENLHLVMDRNGYREDTWYTFSYSPVHDESGGIGGMFCACHETTAQMVADARLRESEARFRNMADNAPVMMWVTDETGHCNYLNPRWYEFTGQSKEEALGIGWTKAIHPDDQEIAKRTFLSENAARCGFRIEYRLRRRDGEFRWVIDAASPRFGDNGAFMGYVGSVIDIHDRRVAEERMRSLNAYLEQQVAERTQERGRLWEKSRDLLAVIGADGNFRDVSPAWERILGHATADVIGRSFRDFIWPADEDLTQRALNAAASESELTDFEIRYRHLAGGYRWISWHTSVEDGLVYAYGRDITAMKEQTETLLKTEEALRQAQKMEAVGQLTGGIAHDFNNLLMGISGSLDMMKRRLDQGRLMDVSRYADAAMSSVERAAALTHRLLAFSRRQALDPKTVDVGDLLSGITDMLRSTLGIAHTLDVNVEEGGWLVSCDPHQLESAILNLCLNARDAMPDAGRLSISVRNLHVTSAEAALTRELEPGDFVAIEVVDTGTGMSPDVVSRVFEPFFTTKPLGQGTGLGLSMVYGFLKQSGGHIVINSREGGGTSITLYLPRHMGALSHEGAAKDEADLSGSEGEMILVVEDEAIIRLVIVDVLEDLGYRTIEASTGTDALNMLLGKERIDLLITDVGLPGINGRQLADQARVTRPNLKVLFITGYAENATMATGFLHPGMELITKPFAVEALAAKVQKILEAPASLADLGVAKA
ncbi:MAG: PAS domain S-box protein [Beijerinckiaceae bacterium]|nr:PAS domain S-box protein [Beijerinckiaceae bacterium]